MPIPYDYCNCLKTIDINSIVTYVTTRLHWIQRLSNFQSCTLEMRLSSKVGSGIFLWFPSTSISSIYLVLGINPWNRNVPQAPHGPQAPKNQNYTSLILLTICCYLHTVHCFLMLRCDILNNVSRQNWIVVIIIQAPSKHSERNVIWRFLWSILTESECHYFVSFMRDVKKVFYCTNKFTFGTNK